MTTPSNDDFLDDVYEPPAPETITSTAASGRRRLPAAATAGWLALGLVAGGVGVAALHSATSSASTPSVTSPLGTGNSRTIPGLSGGGSDDGRGDDGGGDDGGAVPGGFAPGGGGGGFAGEQRLSGTLRSVSGATFTIATSAGMSTYTVDASTQLVKDGQVVPSLSAMNVGDQVLVHVYPQGGSTHVERVIDGAPAGGFGGGTQTT